MAADKRSYLRDDDFPGRGGKSTMIERAMRTASKNRLIPQPSGQDKGETTPRGRKVKRKTPKKPDKPDTLVSKSRKEDASPEEKRSMSISQALLKGAALVPDSSISGALRGLLGGASVGLDIETALQAYSGRKREETAANAAMKMVQPRAEVTTPSNGPWGTR